MIKKSLLLVAVFALLSGLVACDGMPFLGNQRTVMGSSMEPTFHDGDRITVSPVNRELQRGDLVIYTLTDPNNNRNPEYFRRIIGMPGEVVEIKDGVIYIYQEDGNFLVLDEGEYIHEPTSGSFLSDIIPPDSYFVLADNRNNSADSRGHGPIAEDSISGIVNR